MIDRSPEICDDNFDSINNTYKIVGGDAFVNNGYNGSGYRVGLIESYHPNKSLMGSDASSVVNVNSGSSDDHATRTSGIILKFAPSCTVYSYAMKNATITTMAACSYLIDQYSVHVINLSYGHSESGTYNNSVSREMDYLIRTTKVPVVVAAGNDPYNKYNHNVNVYGLAGNAITVGAVISNGTNPDSSSAYSYPAWNCYNESAPFNKPDLCAPGCVKIYSLDEDMGTSFAAPHVTGTVVQMMARNAAFVSQPQKVKAALLASATRNCGSSRSYIEGTLLSNTEGAGILDSEFCYRVSRAGRATHFDATSSSGTFTHNVYCDYTTKPFRIACTWEVAATETGYTPYITNYDMKVYKNGVEVADASSAVSPTSTRGSNNEIIEIPTTVLSNYGGGYYEVRISRKGSFSGSGTVRIGLAWEQD